MAPILVPPTLAKHSIGRNNPHICRSLEACGNRRRSKECVTRLDREAPTARRRERASSRREAEELGVGIIIGERKRKMRRPGNPRWQPSVVLADPENKDLSRSSAASNVATPARRTYPITAPLHWPARIAAHGLRPCPHLALLTTRK